MPYFVTPHSSAVKLHSDIVMDVIKIHAIYVNMKTNHFHIPAASSPHNRAVGPKRCCLVIRVWCFYVAPSYQLDGIQVFEVHSFYWDPHPENRICIANVRRSRTPIDYLCPCNNLSELFGQWTDNIYNTKQEIKMLGVISVPRTSPQPLQHQ